MTISLSSLRTRLAARETDLSDIRQRLKIAKSRPSSTSTTISDIQRRYLSAVASLDDKKSAPRPVVARDAVSSLTSRWDEGIAGRSVEKTQIDVHGDVSNAKKNFSEADSASKATAANYSAAPPVEKMMKKKEAPGPAQLLVEDETGVPSWAVNQQRLVLKKENARSSIRDVDVKVLQGSVISEGARDGSEVQRERVQSGGNVKAALAMWGRTADEDAKIVEERRVEEERKAAEVERVRLVKEAERKEKEVKEAVDKFAELDLKEMPVVEPESEVELLAYLERKIVLIEKEIKMAEEELDKLESN